MAGISAQPPGRGRGAFPDAVLDAWRCGKSVLVGALAGLPETMFVQSDTGDKRELDVLSIGAAHRTVAEMQAYG